VPAPQVAYARDGDIHLAYQVVGDGPIDVVQSSEWWCSLDGQWDDPLISRWHKSIASFSRLLLFDRRGFGLSDPSRGVDTPAVHNSAQDDIRIVMDAAESERAALIAIGDGAPAALAFAALYPERVTALVCVNAFARLTAADDYPAGIDGNTQLRLLNSIDQRWGTDHEFALVAPSIGTDAVFRQMFSRRVRQAASRAAADALLRATFDVDVRASLEHVRCPTLILHRSQDRFVPPAHGLYLASHIANARYIELDGADHLWWIGDVGRLLDLIEEFLTGQPRPTRRARRNATAGWSSLTPSEQAIVALVAEGLTNDEIATRMFISRATAKTHLNHIYQKLAVRSRSELAAETTRRNR
jgi:pimeloyl-ACP methyl ester carboxylesterase/DNA-binding CsgD family transcriptional regulator